MVTDKMLEAFYSKAEVTSRGTILHLAEAIEAALSASDAEPVGWIWKSDIAERWQFVSSLEKPSLGFTPSFEARVQYLRVYAAPPAVAVKALEWTDDEWPRAKCILGCYVINRDYRMVDLIVGHGGVSEIMRARIELSKYASDADLKAAAQADYEARVRAAIVSPADTSPVFTVAQIVEKIKDYGQDSMPTSEYRLACDDLVEAFEALAAATKEDSHDD